MCCCSLLVFRLPVVCPELRLPHEQWRWRISLHSFFVHAFRFVPRAWKICAWHWDRFWQTRRTLHQKDGWIACSGNFKVSFILPASCVCTVHNQCWLLARCWRGLESGLALKQGRSALKFQTPGYRISSCTKNDVIVAFACIKQLEPLTVASLRSPEISIWQSRSIILRGVRLIVSNFLFFISRASSELQLWLDPSQSLCFCHSKTRALATRVFDESCLCAFGSQNETVWNAPSSHRPPHCEWKSAFH